MKAPWYSTRSTRAADTGSAATATSCGRSITSSVVPSASGRPVTGTVPTSHSIPAAVTVAGRKSASPMKVATNRLVGRS